MKTSVLENTHSFTLCPMCLFINPTVKRTIVTFLFNLQFTTFSLYYFFSSKLFLVCFLQFFFVKRSNNFFTITITNNICPRHIVFNFFNHKIFLEQICNRTFCQKVFIFWYPNNITNFKFRIFIVQFFTRVNICAWFYFKRLRFNCVMIDFTSRGSILIVSWHVLLYLVTISSNLSTYTFLMLDLYTYKFCSLRFSQIFQQQQIFLNYSFLHISMLFLSSHDFINLLENSLPLSSRILFGD